MTPESLAVVRRYLAGELDVDSAARAIQAGGDFGLHYSPGTVSGEEQERIEALFGRVFWLAMREADPANVPPKPFGAEEWRAIAKESFGYDPGERSAEPNDTDPNGAA